MEHVGSISWHNSFMKDSSNYYCPLHETIASNITSSTGVYFGKRWVVSLNVKEDGVRNVTIVFNF